MEKTLNKKEIISKIYEDLKQKAKSDGNTLFDTDILNAINDFEFISYSDIEKLLKKSKISIFKGEFDEPSTADLDEFLKDVKIDKMDDLIKDSKLDDPIKMHLKDIGKIPLISQEEEVELAIKVTNAKEASAKLEFNNYLKEYIENKASTIEKLKNEGRSDIIEELESQNRKKLTNKEIEQLKNIENEGKKARDKLVTSNLRLVVSIAKKYAGRGLQFLDLIQEGNRGLMKAVTKFDHAREYKFSTYATWWIRQSITRAVADQARTIRIPVHMVETINKLIKIQRELTQKLLREPTISEIAKEMGISEEKAAAIQKASQETISLESPVGEEDDSSLGDFIADPTALNPYQTTHNSELNEELNLALSSYLTDKEERILRLRFGLIEDGKPRTLEEVGKEFNLTRERIRQIEARALKKLKHPTKSKKLKDFLE